MSRRLRAPLGAKKREMKKSLILKSHFLFLAIILIDWIIKMFWEIGFVNWLETILKIVILVSGIWSFINYLKPFRKINYYFLIYPISLLLVIVALIFRGIVGAIIISIVLLVPFNLNQIQYDRDKIRIYDNSEGLMSMCCSYKVTEAKFLIFEKELGRFDNDRMIDFEKARIKRSANGIQIVFSQEYFDEIDNSYEMKEKNIQLEK